MALLKRKRSGLDDPMSVVTKFVNACNRHDADGVASCLHPDFDSIQPMYPSRNFRGADQVRRNWQAIFDAEPGFRLTVLRSASVDDTIWLELHGAGEAAEVAGVFVMGILGDRIRWARIYSALVEPVPEGMGQPAPALREVPRADHPADAGEEAPIAPVLDIDRPGRRRRRWRGGDEEVAAEGAGATAAAAATEVGGTESAAVDDEAAAGGAPGAAEEAGDAGMLADATAVVVTDAGTGTETDTGADAGNDTDADAGMEVRTVVLGGAGGEEGAAPAAGDGPAADDGGPPTEAVDMVAVAGDVDMVAVAAEPGAPDDPDAAASTPPTPGSAPDDPPSGDKQPS